MEIKRRTLFLAILSISVIIAANYYEQIQVDKIQNLLSQSQEIDKEFQSVYSDFNKELNSVR